MSRDGLGRVCHVRDGGIGESVLVNTIGPLLNKRGDVLYSKALRMGIKTGADRHFSHPPSASGFLFL